MSVNTPTEKFKRSQAVTAVWEGGWSNHAADPGGKTMYGVTEAKWVEFRKKMGLPAKPVRNITRDEAEQIFFIDFWKAAGCEGLVSGVDLATYDASVNSGVSRGKKWLLASLDPKNRHHLTVKNLCARRLTFVEGLRHWKTFGKGWSNRIADIQAKGVAWALLAMSDAPIVAERLKGEAASKAAAAKKQNTAGAGTATAGGGSFVADQATNQVADWFLVGLGFAFVAITLFLVWRAFLNRQQAKAFAAQAEAV